MHLSRSLLLATSIALSLGACTWVKMDPGGQAIRVARMGEDLSYCTRLGEVGVSVKDKVAFYERDAIKVKDELEVMARNEAPSMGADTLQAKDEPLNGEQRFTAFRCRGGQSAQSNQPQAATAPRSGEAETYPIRGD